MLKRLVKLAVFAAIASAVGTAIQKVTQGTPQHSAADGAGAGSVDTWPEVPRNPEGP